MGGQTPGQNYQSVQEVDAERNWYRVTEGERGVGNIKNSCSFIFSAINGESAPGEDSLFLHNFKAFCDQAATVYFLLKIEIGVGCFKEVKWDSKI